MWHNQQPVGSFVMKKFFTVKAVAWYCVLWFVLLGLTILSCRDQGYNQESIQKVLSSPRTFIGSYSFQWHAPVPVTLKGSVARSVHQFSISPDFVIILFGIFTCILFIPLVLFIVKTLSTGGGGGSGSGGPPKKA